MRYSISSAVVHKPQALGCEHEREYCEYNLFSLVFPPPPSRSSTNRTHTTQEKNGKDKVFLSLPSNLDISASFHSAQGVAEASYGI